MNFKRIFLAGVLVWFVSLIIGWLTCGWLFAWVYQIPPIIWLAPEEMAKAENFLGMLFFGLIHGILFAYVFAVIYDGVPKTGAAKGLIYGILVWLIGGFMGIAMMHFYMTIATTVVVYWIVQALIINIINGAIVGGIYKKL